MWIWPNSYLFIFLQIICLLRMSTLLHRVNYNLIQPPPHSLAPSTLTARTLPTAEQRIWWDEDTTHLFTHCSVWINASRSTHLVSVVVFQLSLWFPFSSDGLWCRRVQGRSDNCSSAQLPPTRGHCKSPQTGGHHAYRSSQVMLMFSSTTAMCNYHYEYIIDLIVIHTEWLVFSKRRSLWLSNHIHTWRSDVRCFRWAVASSLPVNKELQRL